MNNKTKALLTLLLISPILSELLSGNSPAPVFFSPIFFLLQVLSYGVPAIIFRELAVRWKLGILGIFTMALCYGIFNEGLLVGTFFLKDAGVISNYGYYNGMNWPWVGFAMIWHGLHAIVYPILITHVLFPEVSAEPWLKNKTVKILVFVSFLESLVLFFTPKGKFPAMYFLLFWVAILFFVWLSRKFKGDVVWQNAKAYFAPMVFGFLTIAFYLGLIIISKTQISIFIYFTIMFLALIAFWKYIKRKGWDFMPMFLFFIVGDYASCAVFAAIGRPLIVIYLSGITITFLLYSLAKKTLKTYTL